MAVEAGALPVGAWVPVAGFPGRRTAMSARRRAADAPESTASAHEKGYSFLARCRAGEPGVREEFVAEYGALVRFAMSSVLRQSGSAHDVEDTEDLFQNLLLAFFEDDCRRLKLYDGRSGASLATFIRVCATRQTLDYLRSVRRQPIFVRETADGSRGPFDDMTDASADPEKHATNEERLRHLRESVTSLPAREQLFLRLHFIEGQSVPETARTLGLTDNATHVLKSRLRAKLRDRLGWDDDA